MEKCYYFLSEEHQWVPAHSSEQLRAPERFASTNQCNCPSPKGNVTVYYSILTVHVRTDMAQKVLTGGNTHGESG